MPEAAPLTPVPPATQGDSPYYVERDGLRFAGTHLLIELGGAKKLTDVDAVEAILREAVAAARATLLRIDLHSFASSGGVTGVAILAESHMSIHTWPETGYVAIDIFVCGACDAFRAIPVLRRGFEPTNLQVAEHKRGRAL